MASLVSLRTSISETIQDKKVTNKKIDNLINKCLLYTANRILLSNLESNGEVNTVENTYIIDIPITWNFHRNLFNCQIDKFSNITILNSIEALLRHYPNFKTDLLKGPIEFVLITKSSIIYYPIPDVVTLKCSFYTKPEILNTSISEPICIPEGMHEVVVENYVLGELYGKVEDGTDGRTVNTNKFKKDYEKALEDLDDVLNSGQSRPLPDRTTNWI